MSQLVREVPEASELLGSDVITKSVRQLASDADQCRESTRQLTSCCGAGHHLGGTVVSMSTVQEVLQGLEECRAKGKLGNRDEQRSFFRWPFLEACI